MTDAIITVVLNSIWQGCLLAAGCEITLRCARRLNAATRYAVWWMVLLTVILIPIAPLIQFDVAPPPPIPVTIEVPPVAAQQFAAVPRLPLADPAPLESRPGIRLPAGEWTNAALVIWVIIASGLLLRVLFSLIALVRLRRSARPAGVELDTRLEQWKTILGVRRRVRIGVSSRIATPVVVGLIRPMILVPEGLKDCLSSDELDRIGVHEMAHVVRRDDWGNLVQKLIEAVLFYHPGVWWIARRLNLEREVACDDAVLTVIPARRAYAACLTRLVEMTGAVPSVAPGARNEISRRIEMLLNGNRNTSPRCARTALAAAFLAVTLALPASSHLMPLLYVDDEPAPPDAQATASEGQDERSTRRAEKSRRASEEHRRKLEDERRMRQEERQREQDEREREREDRRREADEHRREHFRMRNSDLWSSRSVELNGRIDFTPDDREVRSLSPGGELKIEDRRGLTFRRLEITADSSGKLERAYFYNGVRHDYDQSARSWVAALLPDVIRETAIGADERVRRILKQYGHRGVLDEIERIRSDGAKRIYFQELFAAAPLERDALRETVRTAARVISSDGEKARLFLHFIDNRPGDASLQEVVIGGTSSISSDGEKRRVLSELMEKKLASALLPEVCRVAGEIGSDGEKSRVLQDLAARHGVGPGTRSAFFRAVDSISSDGERTRVLLTLLDRSKPERDIIIQAARSAGSISSDGEKSRVLVAVSELLPDDPAVTSAVARAAETISSDGERRRVLCAVAERKLTPEGQDEFARAARGISSDGEKARSLIAFAAVYSPGPAFFDAVNSISSDGNRREVLAAVVANKQALNRDILVRLLRTARGISSDGEKSRVLLEVAEVCPADDTIIAAYMDTLETISSTGEFRRAFSALAKRHPTRMTPKV